MKKIIGIVLVVCALGMTASAQEVVKKEKTRRTASLGQRVHNVFHKHKHYSGYKTKEKEKVERH